MKKITTLTVFLMILLGCISSRAQVIGMRVPDSTVLSGNNIDLPIYADNTLTGNNVFSYVLQLTFNQSYLQVISVITTGTISAAFGGPAVNTSIPGQVTIAGAGTSALAGSGKFIYVRFKALQPGGIAVNFSGAQYNYFNEGLPAMSFDNGILSITALPSITVSPNNGIITKGETMQFSVSGGTAPYQWFVTNPAVAFISASGLLIGTQPGVTKVVAVDNVGLRDTTNLQVEIRAMRLTIPNNLSQWQGSDIDVPVNTTDLTGLAILSGSFTLGFNQNLLSPVGLVQAGTMLAAYPAPLFNPNIPGTISIDFAGTTPLTGSGTLIYIKFHVSTLFTGGTAINFTNGLFNENMVPNFTNGNFTTINLPVLSITPNTGSLVAGQTNQFTLNGGGSPPIVWSVSDPLVASISQAGLLTTVRGGNVTITATDFHGAFATTGNWLVYDTRIFMPDTSSCPAALQFDYPVKISTLPAGESVNSLQATVSYNATYLTFQGLETSGTLTQGWTFATNATTGQVVFAGSGTSAFHTAGTILKLRFTFNPAFVIGTNALLQMTAITLNEGVPNPLVDVNGYIAGVTPPAGVTVTASANPVYTGNTVTFTANPSNGGTNPLFQWKVNGTVIPGATNSTYAYVPVNSDAVSCMLTSNAICITGSSTVTSSPVIMSVVSLPVNNTVTGAVAGLQSKCYNATNTITVAGGATTFTVQSGGSVTMIAGQIIDYLPGTTVVAGGYMLGYIAPAGPFCTAPPVPAVAMGQENLSAGTPQWFFNVYPNPTSGDFTLELNHEIVSGQVYVEVFGIRGTKILTSSLRDALKQHFSLSAMPPGIYVVRVISGNHAETKKIIRL